MKKKIYTITFHSVLNHGAVLQAYALQAYLRLRDHEATLINYVPYYFLYQILRPAKGLRKTLLKYKRLVLFRKFLQKHITQTKIIFTHRNLQKLQSFDAAICGSDQIWNRQLTNKQFDKAFYLSFVKPPTLKIAYAASAGGHTISSSQQEILDLLKSFDSIGVREEHLRNDIVSSGIHENTELVADPTLLISDYSSIADNSHTPDGKYIVSYEVSSEPSRALLSEYVQALKDTTGLPAIHLGDKTIPAADKNLLDISPAHWVSLITCAEYVVTNSFHGCAFAMNYRKQFFYVPHKEKEKNARPFSLLYKTGLTTKIADSFNIRKPYEQYDTNLLKQFISDSQRFLDDSLNLKKRTIK